MFDQDEPGGEVVNIQLYHGQAARILAHEGRFYVCVQDDKGAWNAIMQIGGPQSTHLMTSASTAQYARNPAANTITHQNGALRDSKPAASTTPKQSEGEWQPEFHSSSPAF